MCVSEVVRWCSRCLLCNEILLKVDLEILYSIYIYLIYVIFYWGSDVSDIREIIMIKLLILLVFVIIMYDNFFF